MKSTLILALLLVIPVTSDNAKTPTKQELIQMRATVKNLEEMVAEQQDRLRAHKEENDGLKKRVSTLESRIVTVENAIGPASARQ
jgi:septal ring factor EnvC (AmiA/AmiB activator)